MSVDLYKIETVEDLRVNELVENLNKMSDSSVRNKHFCMWMLLQLFEIMPLWRIVVFYMTLLQVSCLKTNTYFWCCMTNAAQVVKNYSELNDFNQSQKFDLKQVSDFLCNLLYIRNHVVEVRPQPSRIFRVA